MVLRHVICGGGGRRRGLGMAGTTIVRMNVFKGMDGIGRSDRFLLQWFPCHIIRIVVGEWWRSCTILFGRCIGPTRWSRIGGILYRNLSGGQ